MHGTGRRGGGPSAAGRASTARRAHGACHTHTPRAGALHTPAARGSLAHQALTTRRESAFPLPRRASSGGPLVGAMPRTTPRTLAATSVPARSSRPLPISHRPSPVRRWSDGRRLSPRVPPHTRKHTYLPAALPHGSRRRRRGYAGKGQAGNGRNLRSRGHMSCAGHLHARPEARAPRRAGMRPSWSPAIAATAGVARRP